MATRRKDRTVTFRVEDDHLIRTVGFGNEPGYEHRCPRDVFQQVAYSIPDDGATMRSLRDDTGLPYTAIDVALGFMLDRGVTYKAYGRVNKPASITTPEDAMVEFLTCGSKE